MMPTFQTSTFLNEILDDSQTISNGKLTYFHERLKKNLHTFIVEEFLKKQAENPEFTKAHLARRLNKDPAQITRWLANPGNLTLETVSDFVLAICGGELRYSVFRFSNVPQRNFVQEDNLGVHYSFEPTTTQNITGQEITAATTQSGAHMTIQ